MGRRKQIENDVIRVSLVLTKRAAEMLDVVKRTVGATSRSEAIRHLIREKYQEVTGPQTVVGIATRRVSLRGLTDGNELTEDDFEEASRIWEVPTSP